MRLKNNKISGFPTAPFQLALVVFFINLITCRWLTAYNSNTIFYHRLLFIYGVGIFVVIYLDCLIITSSIGLHCKIQLVFMSGITDGFFISDDIG